MHASAQALEAAEIIVVLLAIIIVAFWRTAVKWLIVIASTAIIATLGFGLIMIWQTTQHTAW